MDICATLSLARLDATSALWLLDKPISNSGRLAQKIRTLAALNGWDWSVELVFNRDKEITARSNCDLFRRAIVGPDKKLDQPRALYY